MILSNSAEPLKETDGDSRENHRRDAENIFVDDPNLQAYFALHIPNLVSNLFKWHNRSRTVTLDPFAKAKAASDEASIALYTHQVCASIPQAHAPAVPIPRALAAVVPSMRKVNTPMAKQRGKR
jgi:hypothetical protein